MVDGPIKTKTSLQGVPSHIRDLDPHYNSKSQLSYKYKRGKSSSTLTFPRKRHYKSKDTKEKKKKKGREKFETWQVNFSPRPPACPLAIDQTHSSSLVLGLFNLGRRVPPLPRLCVDFGFRRSRSSARGRRVARRGVDARLRLRVADPGRGALLLLLLLLGLGLACVRINDL